MPHRGAVGNPPMKDETDVPHYFLLFFCALSLGLELSLTCKGDRCTNQGYQRTFMKQQIIAPEKEQETGKQSIPT